MGCNLFGKTSLKIRLRACLALLLEVILRHVHKFLVDVVHALPGDLKRRCNLTLGDTAKLHHHHVAHNRLGARQTTQ